MSPILALKTASMILDRTILQDWILFVFKNHIHFNQPLLDRARGKWFKAQTFLSRSARDQRSVEVNVDNLKAINSSFNVF